MAEILLVNPRRRKKAKRARRKMSAKQRAFFGPRRRKRAARATAAPRRRRRRRSTAVARLSNPRRRRSRRSLTRMVRRRRSNPSLRGLTGGVMPTLKAGLVGATGALGLDLLWGQAAKFLPSQIAGSALAQYAAKLLGAIAVGFIGGKVLRGKGAALAAGAATVVLHDALKAQIQASFPGVPLGEYLTYAPSVGTMGRAGRLLSTGSDSLGQYMSGMDSTADDMGYSGEYSGDGMNGMY